MMGARVLLLLLLAAGASLASESLASETTPSRLGVSGGIGAGSGYAVTGFQLQIRLGSFAASAGVPLPPWRSIDQCNNEKSGGSSAWAAGLRWYRGGDRGLYLGGNVLAYRACEAGAFSGTLSSITVYSLLAGWRFRIGPLYLDLAAGPAVAHQVKECTYCQQRLVSSDTTFGVPSPSAFAFPWGNFEAGLGLAF
jgi:hypothetical protein